MGQSSSEFLGILNWRLPRESWLYVTVNRILGFWRRYACCTMWLCLFGQFVFRLFSALCHINIEISVGCVHIVLNSGIYSKSALLIWFRQNLYVFINSVFKNFSYSHDTIKKKFKSWSFLKDRNERPYGTRYWKKVSSVIFLTL